MKHQKKRSTVAFNWISRKIADPSNAKEYYQSFKRKENTKSVKQSIFENPSIVDIKSIIIEHPKTPQKLSKTIILKRYPK